MPKAIDLTGQKFGTLLVVERAPKTDDGLARWICKCDCGAVHIASGRDLRTGVTKSCGANIHKRGQNIHDLTGQRFGRFVVIRRSNRDKPGVVKWLCRCDCGAYKDVNAYSLTTGRSQSCGCFCREQIKKSNTIHGKSRTRLYNTWSSMKGRCYSENDVSYPLYGGRGIKMCDEWRDNADAFIEWALKNGYSDELSIDRIDVNGNYEPSNCRWATDIEQANNKRTTVRITYGGVTRSAREWSEITGIDQRKLTRRVRDGWSAARTLGFEV